MFKKVSLVIIAVLALLDIGAGSYFFNEAVLRRPEVEIGTMPPIGQDFARAKFKFERGVKEWIDSQPFLNVETMSDDGLRLHGYFLSASEPSFNTVILVHGYRKDGKTDVGKFGRLYHDRFHYNVLIVDDRAHGESEGKYIGFGFLDRKDVLKWIDFILKRSGKDVKIVLHGLSMGGATVLLDSAEILPSNVKAIVSDSAYTDASEELSDQLDAQYHLPSFPFLQTTSLMTWVRAGYLFSDASPVKAVAKSTKPILFIHGGDDVFVPTSMAYTLYDKCICQKELMIVPHARHTDAYFVAPDVYEKNLSAFLTKYVGATT